MPPVIFESYFTLLNNKSYINLLPFKFLQTEYFYFPNWKTKQRFTVLSITMKIEFANRRTLNIHGPLKNTK